jgi:hypothetical protein
MMGSRLSGGKPDALVLRWGGVAKSRSKLRGPDAGRIAKNSGTAPIFAPCPINGRLSAAARAGPVTAAAPLKPTGGRRRAGTGSVRVYRATRVRARGMPDTKPTTIA